MESDKTTEIGFSNLFLKYFHTTEEVQFSSVLTTANGVRVPIWFLRAFANKGFDSAEALAFTFLFFISTPNNWAITLFSQAECSKPIWLFHFGFSWENKKVDFHRNYKTFAG